MTADATLAALTAGLDRREQIARAAMEAAGAEWHYGTASYADDGMGWVHGPLGVVLTAEREGEGSVAEPVGVHMALNDPADALHVVAAIREVIADYELHSDAKYPDFEGGYASALEDVIEALAGIYTEPQEVQP